VKTDLTTYGSLLQSQKRLPGAETKVASKTDPKIIDPKLLKPSASSSPDYKVDLSKPMGLPTVPGIPPLASLPTPSIPDAPKLDVDKPKGPENKPEIKKPDVVEEVKVKDGTLKKPAVIFVKGLDVFSSPSNSERGYAGVGKMADAVEGARIYGWDQHADIIKEIKKREITQPIILVGHSFGGDTAIEVADELDSLEHGFRKVDLLVTIDSVGLDNDIIPQNVKNHLNVFGENDFILNDGPHVARRNEMTKVKNILSQKDHTELDDDKEVQFEIVNMIQDTLGKRTV
jgi:hypothetical protein